MPFTPFHMGPGLFVKALLQGSFSLMVFGWTQIVMDLQPLLVMLHGNGHVHGFTHTLIGATLVGVLSAFTGKYASEYGLRLIGQTIFLPISWTVTITSALTGVYSHVLLDGIMHDDVEPFAPFSLNNPLLGLISIHSLHQVCLYTGLFGSAIYIAISLWQNKTKRGAKPKS